VYAAELARLAGRLDDATAARHRSAFARVGLPTTYDGAGFDDLVGAMRVDKKARGSRLRFLVLDGLARPGILAGPDEELLREAFRAVSGERSS
jgi:3-dehydroquinate synthase